MGLSKDERTDHDSPILYFSLKGINMDVCTRILMEGNLANEVGLIVLDTIELFCGHFKVSALIPFFILG